jgi:hypothetical protein
VWRFNTAVRDITIYVDSDKALCVRYVSLKTIKLNAEEVEAHVFL